MTRGLGQNTAWAFFNTPPMNAVDCLANVIGISENPCVCYDGGRQAEYAESKSGYYMDGMDYGLPLSYPEAVHDCEYNDLWDLCIDARHQGIQQFVTEFGAAMIGSKWIRKNNPWAGSVGTYKDTTILGTGPGKHGIVIDPQLARGTTVTINQIKGYGAAPGGTTITLEVYEESELLAGNTTPTETLTATIQDNGQYGSFIVRPGKPITINLLGLDGTPQRVFVVAVDDWSQYSTTIATSTGKSCCGGRKRTRNTTLNDWVTVQGISAPDAAGLPFAGSDSNQTYGLEVNMTIGCSSTFWCQPFDWANDEWARVCAELILLYSNRMLISFILRTNKANIYTAVRSEELITKQQYINQLIGERLTWAVENLPQGTSDCYYCRGSRRKTALLV